MFVDHGYLIVSWNYVIYGLMVKLLYENMDFGIRVYLWLSLHNIVFEYNCQHPSTQGMILLSNLNLVGCVSYCANIMLIISCWECFPPYVCICIPRQTKDMHTFRGSPFHFIKHDLV